MPSAPISSSGCPKAATLLHDQPPHGWRPAKQLIVGRLDLTPHHETQFYDFRGIGTLGPIVAGVVPQSVASRRDSSWGA